MYQSIPAVNIPLPSGDRPLGFAHPFSPAPGVFPTNFCSGARGLDQVTYFQILIKIYSVSLNFFSQCFREAIRTARKALVFVHSTHIYLLYQISKRVINSFLKKMLPESVFEMPFGIKILPNICLIRTISAKACLLDLPQGWGFRAFSHKMIALEGVVLQQIFPFCPFKNSPGVVSLESKFFFYKKTSI